MIIHLSEPALERFTSFGDLLKFLRRRAGLTQRELSIAVGYSHAQISRLELNQRPPDLATIAARFIPALDLKAEPEVTARLLELAAAMPPDEAPAEGPPPFKGLQAFDEADASLFFGREALTSRLVERMYTSLSSSPLNRFIAVVGASGSGKSSIVRAGLVPAVRRNLSFAQWRIHILTPTERPLQALSTSLTRGSASVTSTATLMDDLAADRRALHLFAARLLSQGNGSPKRPPRGIPPHLFLVVDQFEELFTLCRAEGERRAFIDNLMTAATEPGGATFVVLVLRADFYASCAQYASLRTGLASQQEYIGPLSAAELRRVIEEPARRGDWALEPGLVEVLLQDLGADGDHLPEPGALPLLSHALLETWHRRRVRTLSVSGYLASGGVRGAIAETADDVYHDDLDPGQQTIARNIFLRLTQLGEDEAAGETRRRATFKELIGHPEDEQPVRTVLTRLADARLIITENDVAEVAHEALIREWPTLRGWLEEDREGLRLHRHLTLAAEVWERGGRDPGELYRGVRLARATEWAGEHTAELSELEREFLAASRDLAGREEAEREAQRQRELEAARTLAETQRRAAAQLRRRAFYLFGAFILAVILAGVALYLGEVARQSAVAAQNERRLAFTRELAAAAVSNLEVDPERSVLLALQAVATTKDFDGTVLPEAQEALHRSVLASQVRLTLRGRKTNIYTVTFSPDGNRLASIESDGTVIVWDAFTGQELLRLPGHTEISDEFSSQRLAFSPDGNQLAAGDGSLIRIWDPDSGTLVRTLSGHTDVVWSIAYSADGKQIATGSADWTVRIWDAATGAPLHLLGGHSYAIGGLDFSPDGKWLASASDDSTLKVWDTTTGELLLDLTGFPDIVDSVDFSPDGALLAAPSGDGLHIWSLSTTTEGGVDKLSSQEILLIDGAGGTVAFSPDGNQVATSSGSVARLWDTHTGRELLTLTGHTDWVVDVAFSPDGKRLATASFDETVKVWNIGPGQEAVSVAGPGRQFAFVVFSPDGSKFATPGADGSAVVWDAVTGEKLEALVGHALQVMGIAYSPDGSRLATASIDATVIVWDILSGQPMFTLSGHEIGVRDVAFSPDGSRIATAGFDQTARLWDAETGKELLKLSGHEGLVLGVAFSPDGARLATSSTDGTVKLWDLANGKVLYNLQGGINPKDIAFSPDGTRLATGSSAGGATIWDAATGKELVSMSAPRSDTQSLAFSPDGLWLATGSADNTATVWDVATGKEIYTLPGSVGGVVGVAFNPVKGRDQLAVSSADGIVRVYLLQIDDLVALARARLTRALTQEECQKYLHVEACPVNEQ